ncbi:MAG: SURF1 family protein [Caldilineaceae bacterium]
MMNIMVVTKLFSRRWWFATLLVVAAVFVLIRLGFWQLDRLEQRRAFNRMVAARWDQAPFDLNQSALPSVLEDLGYRRVQVEGHFDYANQILLKNQTRDDAPGAILVTPLVFADNKAILVARGWIPLDLAPPERWAQLDEAQGDTTIVGMIQASQVLAGAKAPTEPQLEWFRIDIEAIQPQMPYTLQPVFLTQLPEPGRSINELPYREVPFTLTEANHFSYALQWFMFAVVLGIGYLQYINFQERRTAQLAAMPEVPPMVTDVDSSADIAALP